MTTIAQLAVSPEATALYALILAGLEKKFQFIKPIVKWGEAHKDVVQAVVTEGEQLLSEVVHSPQLAGVELELQHVKSQLQDNKLVQLCGQVLHAAGKRFDELTPNQKTGMALVVSTEAKKLGLNVTPSQVNAAFDIADKAVAAIESLDLFKSTQQIDQESQPANPPAPSTASTEANTTA